MNAGKRNPTRARSGPDLAGGAGAGAPRGGRLFFRSVRDRAAVRPGRGAARPERSARATAAPPLSSRRGGAPAVAVLGPGWTWRPQLFPGYAGRSPPKHPPPRPHSVFLSSTPAQGKLSVSKILTSGAAVSDKKLPLSTTRRLQPTTDFNFLPLNTRYLFSGLNKKVPFF